MNSYQCGQHFEEFEFSEKSTRIVFRFERNPGLNFSASLNRKPKWYKQTYHFICGDMGSGRIYDILYDIHILSRKAWVPRSGRKLHQNARTIRMVKNRTHDQARLSIFFFMESAKNMACSTRVSLSGYIACMAIDRSRLCLQDGTGMSV